MNDLNSILLEGNLEADPVLSYAENGATRCTFAVISKRTRKVDGEPDELTGDAGRYAIETGHFSIIAWSHLAEVCGEYLRKGRGVRIVGHLRQDEAKLVEIVAEHVEFKPERAPAPPADSPEAVNAEVAETIGKK